MKKIFYVLVVLFTIYSGSVYGNGILDIKVDSKLTEHVITDPIIVAPELPLTILTEREIGMVAYNHYMDNLAQEIIPEIKVRVQDIELHEGVFSVSLALVSATNGSFIRNLVQYEIDGDTGSILSTYKIRGSEKSIREILAMTNNKTLTREDIIEMVETIQNCEDNLIETIITDLKDNCGDSLDEFILLMKIVKSNNIGLTNKIRPVGDNVAKAVFGEMTIGNLALNRESMRLLNEIKAI